MSSSVAPVVVNVKPRHESDASVHLDAIRGLAALAVFLGHGRPIFLSAGLRGLITGSTNSSASLVAANATVGSTVAPASPDSGLIGAHETIGHEAVIIFFVLSGYFVGGSALRAASKGMFSWSRYLFQRFTRLWIVLVPALLLGWALDAGGMHFLGNEHNIYSAPAGQEEVWAGLADRLTPVTFLGNLAFLQTMFFQPFGTNTSLWSLSYEFWYYVLFPMLLALYPGRKTIERVVSGALIVAILWFFGSEFSRYFVVWLLGAGVALLPLKLPERSRGIVSGGVTLVFVAALVVLLKTRLNLYLSDLVLATLFSALVWAILHATRATAGAIYRKLAQGLSSMSYTLYCVHMPYLAFVSALIMPNWQPWPFSIRSAAMLLGIYAMVFVFAWLIWYAFERNTEAIRKKLRAVLA